MSKKQLQHPPFSQRLREAEASQDFAPVRDLIRSKPFGKQKNQQLFWASSLPECWAREIIRLPESIGILLEYFKQEATTNEAFVRLIFEHRPAEAMRGTKLGAAYRSDVHWKCMPFLDNKLNVKLRIFYKELEYLRELEAHWATQEAFYQGVLQATPIPTLLIQAAAYFERVKRDPQMIANDALLASKEISLCYVLNELLTQQRNSLSANQDDRTLEQLQHYAAKALLPNQVSIDRGNTKHTSSAIPDPTEQLIRETIDFFFQQWTIRYQIDRYLCGYQDFDEIEELSATLYTNKRFATQQRNDQKGYWPEVLFLNQALDDRDHEIENIPFGDNRFIVEKLMKYSSFLGLPENFTSGTGARITLRRLFELLSKLSSEPQTVEANSISSYLLIASKETLASYLERTLETPLAEINQHIDFLTSDLEDRESRSVNILSRPFLKIGPHYFWLSSLMTRRRWDNLMHQRIVTEKTPGVHKEQSAAQESSLAESFRRAGFRAVASWEHPEYEGEVDVIAYRDKTLFLAEIKSTVQQEEPLRHGWYQAMRFERTAYLQLKRAVEFAKIHFDQFRSDAVLRVSCSAEELTIVPLIVSNVFEADDILIQDAYRKVSLFELKVILENKLYDTLHNRLGSYLPGDIGDVSVASIVYQHNRANRHYKFPVNSEPLSQEECNLWSSFAGCTPEDLLAAIQERKVWRGLDETMNYTTGEKSFLFPYDRGLTFLNYPG